MEKTDIAVLVVDDNLQVRRALEELINATDGMRVAGTASELSQTMDADDWLGPRVAVVDVLLPEQSDGLAVVKALTNRRWPVVATSVSSTCREAAITAGAARFVEKGPDAQSLLAALRHSALVP